MTRFLSWVGIARLGLVQMALGAIVVIPISTLNRVMVVELALAATLPGVLVAIHYSLQILRPRWGYGGDGGANRTPWILGGMASLALGGAGAALATALMASSFLAGVILAVLSFILIGIGAGSAGTNLLVLLAKLVHADRRPAAAAIVWIMMISGLAITAGTARYFLDPFSLSRLVSVSVTISIIAFFLALIALWGIERNVKGNEPEVAEEKPPFLVALREVWSEREARYFTIFVFISMLAYGGQELILEPFAGAVFGLTVGQTTGLSAYQHSGVLIGMLLAAIGGSVGKTARPERVRMFIAGGCIASAIALIAFAMAGSIGSIFPLRGFVLMLGIANGAYAVAAISAMMTLAGSGTKSREGTRMGVWGAAQGIAFGSGGLVSTMLVDLARSLTTSPISAYATVFVAQAGLFIVAAAMALHLQRSSARGANSASYNPDSQSAFTEAGAR